MNQKIKLIISILILGLMSISFCFAQDIPVGFEAPETFEQAQQLGEEALEIGKKQLPDIIRDVWNNNVLPVWQKMYDWAYTNIWLRIKNLLGSRVEQEIEIRKEIVDQEFEQEKEEVKKELPGILNKILEFIKNVVYKLKILWK